MNLHVLPKTSEAKYHKEYYNIGTDHEEDVKKKDEARSHCSTDHGSNRLSGSRGCREGYAEACFGTVVVNRELFLIATWRHRKNSQQSFTRQAPFPRPVVWL